MARYTPPAPPKGPLIVAAAIIGGSVLTAGMLVNGTLKDTSEKLEGIQSSLTETRDQLKELAANRPAAKDDAPRRGPDPNKVYKINTKGAPAKGPASAKVQLVEFSDFQ